MSPMQEPAKFPNPVRARLGTLLFALGLLWAHGGSAQTATPPDGTNSTNPLAVSLSLWLPDPEGSFHAPATIGLMAQITLNAPAPAGDSVRVDFFANTNKLGSRKSVWHDAIGPDPHARNFQPMIMRRAGFDPVEMEWSNAPAGGWAVTARATGVRGRSAVSAPLNITVLPTASP